MLLDGSLTGQHLRAFGALHLQVRVVRPPDMLIQGSLLVVLSRAMLTRVLALGLRQGEEGARKGLSRDGVGCVMMLPNSFRTWSRMHNTSFCW